MEGLKVNIVIHSILYNVAYCRCNRMTRQVVDDKVQSSNMQRVCCYILPLIGILDVCIRYFINLENTWCIDVEKFRLFKVWFTLRFCLVFQQISNTEVLDSAMLKKKVFCFINLQNRYL